MWRVARILQAAAVLATLFIGWLPPESFVSAATSADVTLTATPIVAGGGPGAPTDFTLTDISDYEVSIVWTKGVSANNTMIRAVVGRYADNISDGYLVYYGTGTSASDFGVNLDVVADQYYYRAWSEDTNGDWSTDYAEGKIGGTGVTLLALVLLAL